MSRRKEGSMRSGGIVCYLFRTGARGRKRAGSRRKRAGAGGVELLAAYFGQEQEEGKEQDQEELRLCLFFTWDRNTRKEESRSRMSGGIVSY